MALACVTSLSEAVAQRISWCYARFRACLLIRDLVVDMGLFYKQYEKIQPYLINNQRQHRPSSDCRHRKNVKSLMVYTSASFVPAVQRPVLHFWWNPDKFVGPAGLLQAYRFLADSRDDEATEERLSRTG